MDIKKNLANLTTFIRTYLIFVIISLLNTDISFLRVLGTILLIFAAILDGVDGYLARKYRSYNKFGGLIDTLGDRITENVLLIFFAYKQLISLWIPLIFVTRSFVSDFIRSVCFSAGVGTFAINQSKLGFYFVASKPSRFLYLVFKIFVFTIGAVLLCLKTPGQDMGTNSWGVDYLTLSIRYTSWILVVFNLIRFGFLVYDFRNLLKKEVLN